MEGLSAKPALQFETPTIYHNNEEIRIVLVGKTGAGKSATGNTILGKEQFKSKFSPKSVTECCAKADGEWDGQKVSVIDTPGLFDTKIDEEKTRKSIVQCISYASPGPHVFLVIVKLDRYTEEEKQTVQKIQKIFGEQADKYSMVLFTHGDLLKGQPIEEFLRDSEELQQLVAKCNGQYHVFNNELKDELRDQVRELLDKIRNIKDKNGGSHYTNDTFQKAERAIEEEKQRILKEKEEEMRKEQEELRIKIQRKYEKLIKEAKQNMKREQLLRVELEKEKERAVKALILLQGERAREEAEKSSSLLTILMTALGGLGLAAAAVIKLLR